MFEPFSSIAFFKRLADVINHEHWGLRKARVDLLEGFQKRYNILFDETVLSQIHSVEFFNSICVVRKAKAEENQLGLRVIAGSEENVVQGHSALDQKGLKVFDQDVYLWPEFFMSIEEELTLRMTEIATLEMEKDLPLRRNDELSA